MFEIEFGNLSFDIETSEQLLCVIVGGKSEVSSLNEFIFKALDYLEKSDRFFDEVTEYRKCIFADALKYDVKWLYEIFEGMKRKVSFNIGETMKVLTGNITVFDNVWAVETEDLFYYIHWCTTA